MVTAMLGWTMEKPFQGDVLTDAVVGDLGVWGPRGVFFHDDGWMRTLCSPIWFISLPILFLTGVVLGTHVMQKTPAMNFPRAVQAYNCAQILVCSYMVYGMCPSWKNPFSINSAFTKELEWFVFVHYLSKYLDWCDTIFIVIRKKRAQLSLLHVYHHATISAVWGYLCYTGNGNGTVSYGAWINSLTHVIMYSHYLWTSFGLRNPFKRWITRWQISQFWSCIVHAVLVVSVEGVLSAGPAWLQIMYQWSMVYLFTWKMSYVPSCIPDMSETEKDRKAWTLIRGVQYDVTKFEHPGGSHMISLAAGRDATLLYESAHSRSDKAAKALKLLPQLSPTEDELKSIQSMETEGVTGPMESPLYNVLQERVRKEVLEPAGKCTGVMGSRGVPVWYYAPVLLSFFSCAVLFVVHCNVLTGMLMGACMAWVGLAVQHTANHGSIAESPTWGFLLGLMNDVAPGGSSLVWRFHHHVSHHMFCNHATLDQDSYTSYPLMRLDPVSQPWKWYHKYQCYYMPVVVCALYWSIQIQDVICLLTWRSEKVHFTGADSREFLVAILLKFLHFAWFWAAPYHMHGLSMVVPCVVATFTGSAILSLTFLVSHNTPEQERVPEEIPKGMDWAEWQIKTSCSWGGPIACFFTGGLNLQIEHHLFPCLPHNHYPAVKKIVQEECKKRSIHYSYYASFPENLNAMLTHLSNLGAEPKKVD